MALCPNWDYRFYTNKPLGELDDSLLGATEVESYFPTSRWLWMQLILPRLIERDNPDLCHFTNSLGPFNMPRPYVLTIHDASLFLYRHFHPWSRIAAMRLLLPAVARRSAAVIVPSYVARGDLVRVLDLPPEKVHVIYEAAPDWFGRVTDQRALKAIRRRYKLPEDFILFIGTLEPRKNLERLIRALALVHQRGHRIPLVLVGQQGWHMEGRRGRPGLHSLVHEVGLESYVHHLGYVPTRHLPGLLSLTSIFAFPSIYEGFGLPAVEAMACGTPVLTSRNTAMDEICGDAANLVDPFDVEDIANGLEKMLVDVEYRRELSEHGLCCAGQLSWSRAAKETVDVYKKVLSLADDDQTED
jgi:glycosyltransferase involved in cell wall biosynthesis